MNRVDEQEPFHFHYHVFLSFRGEDTRRNFTQSLYAALHLQGIRTFIDNVCIQRGCEITPSLFGAILDSAMAVVVISRNYANSSWCLEELAKIIDCGRLILPVFYGVNPRDVRMQKGPFKDDFRSHEKLFGNGSEQVLRWRKAFEKVGGISGWVSNDWEEAKLIQDLVGMILTKLGNTPLPVANPFDINIHVEEVTMSRISNADATLSMHDQLRDMGRQYVGQENQDLGKLRRLWDCEDIMPPNSSWPGKGSEAAAWRGQNIMPPNSSWPGKGTEAAAWRGQMYTFAPSSLTTFWERVFKEGGQKCIFAPPDQQPGSWAQASKNYSIMPARKYYKGTRSIKAIILNFFNYGIPLLRSKKSSKSSSRRSFNLSPAEEKDGVLEKPGLSEDLSS